MIQIRGAGTFLTKLRSGSMSLSTRALSTLDVETIATEVLRASDTGTAIPLLSKRYPNLNAESAYQVTRRIHDLRIDRGERPIGRKLGFTNRSIWAEYDVDKPNWSYVYNTTVRELTDKPFSLDNLAQPRIEPEVMFRLSRDPGLNPSEDKLLDCIDAVAHGFEIVHSVFPDWKFTIEDTTAAAALHGALFVGPWEDIRNATDWKETLATFKIELYKDDELVDRGGGANVLDGPLSALTYLVNLLGKDEHNTRLAAGEIITTGTLTRAWPVVRGETWWTRLDGIRLPGAMLRFQ